MLRASGEAWKRFDPVCCSLELAAVAYIRPDTVSQEPPRLNHPVLKIPIRHFQVAGRRRGFLILAAAKCTLIFILIHSVFNLTTSNLNESDNEVLVLRLSTFDMDLSLTP